jgi:hypothetical protein
MSGEKTVSLPNPVQVQSSAGHDGDAALFMDITCPFFQKFFH